MVLLWEGDRQHEGSEWRGDFFVSCASPRPGDAVPARRRCVQPFLGSVYLNRENALRVVTIYGVHGERREADGEIFRAFFT